MEIFLFWLSLSFAFALNLRTCINFYSQVKFLHFFIIIFMQHSTIHSNLSTLFFDSHGYSIKISMIIFHHFFSSTSVDIIPPYYYLLIQRTQKHQIYLNFNMKSISCKLDLTFSHNFLF